MSQVSWASYLWIGWTLGRAAAAWRRSSLSSPPLWLDGSKCPACLWRSDPSWPLTPLMQNTHNRMYGGFSSFTKHVYDMMDYSRFTANGCFKHLLIHHPFFNFLIIRINVLDETTQIFFVIVQPNWRARQSEPKTILTIISSPKLLWCRWLTWSYSLFKLSLVLSVQETTHFTAVAAYCLMLGHVCVSELNK